MTKDEIIRMAREAGLICESRPVTAWMESTDLTPYLTRFAALVAAHEREKQTEQEPVAWGWVMDGEVNDCIGPTEHARCEGEYTVPLYAAPVSIEAAVLAEREACAKVCDDIDTEYEGEDVLATCCAAAIRARGNDASS